MNTKTKTLKEFRRKNSGISIIELRKQMFKQQKKITQDVSETQEIIEVVKQVKEKPKRKRRSKKIEQEGK